MKTTLAIASFFIATFASTVVAADSKPQFPPDFFSPSVPRTVEQRFQEADITLAISQYEKLQMAAFELRLKLQLDPPADEGQRNELAKRAEILRIEAAELREQTIQRAAVAAVQTR
jgi:hypothetical protein